MIRQCLENDFEAIYEIINDATKAYKGVIPADRWHEPYMPKDQLQREIGDGVNFWGLEENGKLIGVMGIQDKGEVTLIRHAYVRTALRHRGVGSQLLRHLETMTDKLYPDRYLGCCHLGDILLRKKRLQIRICEREKPFAEKILEYSRTTGGNVSGSGKSKGMIIYS